MRVIEKHMEKVDGINGCYTDIGNTTVEMDAILEHPGYPKEQVHYILHNCVDEQERTVHQASVYIEYVNCGYVYTCVSTAKVFQNS